MITLEQAIPGTQVLHKSGEKTTVLSGHYDDPELGLMIKTSKFPGGMPATDFSLAEDNSETLVETLPAIIFEGVILDQTEPVRFTPELIRSKTADLITLSIKDIFDNDGLTKVKAAKQKIVKTRTAIEKIEKSEKDKLKVRHEAEKKELTDYAATLYAACREGEDALQLKITAHENEKALAAKKLDDEKKEKTEGRDNVMFALGMMFNGTGFSGYTKWIDQPVLHAMSDEKYAELLTEIEGLRMEHGTNGTMPAPAATPQAQNGIAWAPPQIMAGSKDVVPTVDAAMHPKTFENAVYDKPCGNIRILLTKGTITLLGNELIANDRISDSAVYLNVVAL